MVSAYHNSRGEWPIGRDIWCWKVSPDAVHCVTIAAVVAMTSVDARVPAGPAQNLDDDEPRRVDAKEILHNPIF